MKIVLEPLSNGAVLATVIEDGQGAVERAAFTDSVALMRWQVDRLWVAEEIYDELPAEVEAAAKIGADNVNRILAGAGDIAAAAKEMTLAKWGQLKTEELAAEGDIPHRAHVDHDALGKPHMKPFSTEELAAKYPPVPDGLDAGTPSDVEAAE